VNALEIEGVYKYYGDFAALRDIGFRVTPGSTVALLGRNGAGKTTLLRIIAGLSKPSQGTVRIFGANVRDDSARHRIGVLGHGISLYEELSAFENLTIFAKLYGLERPKQAADQWLERTGLDRAFIHDPDVLLFDEPFTALDDRAIAVLQGLLADAHSKGRTILMSTHQLKEALVLATHVVLIQRGETIYSGLRTQQMVDDTGWLYRTYADN